MTWRPSDAPPPLSFHLIISISRLPPARSVRGPLRNWELAGPTLYRDPLVTTRRYFLHTARRCRRLIDVINTVNDRLGNGALIFTVRLPGFI
ncbi:SH2B adapter protein 3-like protein [Corchorus olitorius]|uniref:SH2B adapter protein 3-like protein n=1 Tax=Corchorus olitorius TaxID=93759 RepID=A0A1R3IPB6_9ROSI|nr:SH2B adapter protein 3-like protein [Corchorus olitorius]